ncbi:flagellar hook-associated protein FlgL [Pseudohongiella sp. O18]|uniref:flagellar hook-associated protein FlgL n=1 Tax=Pseudohongiella sp. O18 TaxID=2904248 RepID=UPI001F028BE6|nr:flagellar hook-associated protein FlgL [Pseudohongiella sp. O18]
MSYRLSTGQLFTRALNPMLDVQKAVSKTQEQIATQKRVLTPADDPIASTRILQLNQELAGLEKYNNSLSTLKSRLEREEVALGGVSNLIQRAQELVASAGNGAISANERGYIATELQSVIDAMAQEMNARDSNGEFLFAGYQGKTQPFVKGPDGRFDYKGDQGQRFIQAGPVTSIAANDSGYQVFMDVPGATPSAVSRAGEGNQAQPPASISKPLIVDQEQFNSFYPESVTIEFRPNSEVVPPGMNYTVKQISDGRVLSQNVRFQPGQAINIKGAQVIVEGRPSVGDTFLLESTARKGLLEGLEEFVEDLGRLSDSSSDRVILASSIENTIANLGNAQEKLLNTRAAVGSRLNQVEAAKSSNADFELVVRTTLSELSDLDYAEAISQLTQQTFVLEAAQATFTKITRLSLFNML